MRSIEWLDAAVRFIDQTKLPLEEHYITTGDYRIVAEAISTLRIRGAPLIGISASYGVALAAIKFESSDGPAFKQYILNVISELGATRPTAINLRWALDTMKSIVTTITDTETARRDLINAAITIHRDDAERCERIGDYGAALIPSDVTILTHCNTGALATGGEGTALSVIKKAHRLGKLKHVFVDETRPLFQGARLTMWELLKEQIPSTLITDDMAASVMQNKKIDLVIVGADHIAANGDTANKIGTYALAVLARYHNIPFYVAAPASTINPAISTGDLIKIEERSPDEVTRWNGIQIAPLGTRAYNPAFDVTPAELITAIITDKGVFRGPYDFVKQT